jgi:hypothetical protein
VVLQRSAAEGVPSTVFRVSSAAPFWIASLAKHVILVEVDDQNTDISKGFEERSSSLEGRDVGQRRDTSGRYERRTMGGLN